MRNAFLALALASTFSAFALNGGEWIEVAGGAWKPSPAALSAAKLGVHDRLVRYFDGHLGWYKWERYSFQYQGIRSEHGQTLIHVNAFCTDLVQKIHTDFDYAHDWLRAYGGGACFFRGDFDPAKNEVTAFTINAPK